MEKKLTIGRDPRGHAVTLELNIEYHKQEFTTTGEPIVKRSVTMEPITTYKMLTISGESARGCGQMQDTIREELDQYRELSIPKENILRILDIWDEHHLGDMSAACVHQSALGWDSGKQIEFATYSIDWDMYRSLQRQYEKDTGDTEGKFRRRHLSSAGDLLYRLSVAGIKPFAFTAVSDAHLAPVLQGFEAIPEHELKKYMDDLRIQEAESYINRRRPPILKRIEKKGIGWLHPEDHQEGVLTKPCPTCGYKYGTAWLVAALPQEIEFEITALFTPAEPVRVVTPDVEFHDKLKELGIEHRIVEQAIQKCPRWCDGKHVHGKHYRGTFWRPGKTGRVTFDFWNSQHDKETGEEPTAYDILSCVVRDVDSGSFEEFCSEFGYSTDSRDAEATYKLIKKSWAKVTRLLRESEIKQLQELAA